MSEPDLSQPAIVRNYEKYFEYLHIIYKCLTEHLTCLNWSERLASRN
jgi:hypothetical protein